MKLYLEQLENRILLAAPIEPFDLDLVAGDSGVNDDDITNLDNGTLELIAEKDGTVAVYNAGYLGDAAGQGDALFYETNNVVVIEAERGTITAPMLISTARVGYEHTGYITSNTNTNGTATYSFYVSTADNYYIHGHCNFDSTDRNSIYVNIDDTWQVGDGDNWPTFWSDTTNDTWHMTTAMTTNGGVTKNVWPLTVGWHNLEIQNRLNLPCSI